MSVTNYLDNEAIRLSFKELDFLAYVIKNDDANVYNSAATFGVNVDTILSKYRDKKLVTFKLT